MVAVMGSGSAPGLEEIRVPVRSVGDCLEPGVDAAHRPYSEGVAIISVYYIMHSGCAQKPTYVTMTSQFLDDVCA